MKLSILIKKIKFKFFPRLSGKYDFNAILENDGIRCGKHTLFYDPKSMCIDRSMPHLLEIGDYCKITHGCVILAHDYSPSVLISTHHKVLDSSRKTVIGNNVFIGVNSIILSGSTIGDNVIVGAGSVVCGTIPPNVVVGGNPARIMRTIDEHQRLLSDSFMKRALAYYKNFVSSFGREPKKTEMAHYFSLYSNEYKQYMFNGVDQKALEETFSTNTTVFDSFDSFLDFCRKSIGDNNN